MSFSQEVGQFFALTEAQSAQLEAGLTALEQDFQQAGDETENTPESAGNFYQKFQQLMAEFGIPENKEEQLLDHLYATEQYRQLVSYIISSYYQSDGDRSRFEELYQQILTDEQV